MSKLPSTTIGQMIRRKLSSNSRHIQYRSVDPLQRSILALMGSWGALCDPSRDGNCTIKRKNCSKGQIFSMKNPLLPIKNA